MVVVVVVVVVGVALTNCPLGDVNAISNVQISNTQNGMTYVSGK